MRRRNFLAAGLASAVAACSRAQDATPGSAPQISATAPGPAAPPAPPPLPDTVDISLKTDKGEIVVRLEAKKAPITVANYLRYVDAGKMTGAAFWRAADAGASGFIQATAKGATFPPIAHEPTSQTGLSHTSGAISMSRFAPGTATADFVICVGDNTFLDAGREGSDDKLGYAAFGHVVKGMDVVRKILHGKIDKHTPAGGWKGQMLATPVVIESASRVAPPA